MTSSAPEYAYKAGLGMGVAVLGLGVHALLRPLQSMAFNFPYGIPTNAAEGRKFATSVMRLYGIRNFYVGLINIAIWYRGDRTLLGLSAIFGIGTAVVDGLVSYNQLGYHDWKHYGTGVVAAALGGILLAGENGVEL